MKRTKIKLRLTRRETFAEAWDATVAGHTHLWTKQEAWLDRSRYRVNLKEGVTPPQAKERLEKAYQYTDIRFYIVDGYLEKETTFSIGD